MSRPARPPIPHQVVIQAVNLRARGWSWKAIADELGNSPSGLRQRIARTRDVSPRRTPLPCGTDAAYGRHIRRREIPCDLCCAAHNAVQRARSGRLGLDVYVDAGPAREAIREMRAAGWSLRCISRLTGVSRSTLQRMGRQRSVRTSTHAALTRAADSIRSTS